MTEKTGSDKAKKPRGFTVRELHQKVKQSHLHNQQAGRTRNALAQPQNRWQRFARYVWDKKKG